MILDERDVEGYLVKRMEEIGGVCIKHGQDGWPDRICIFPSGRIVWCETKRPKGKPEPLQLYRKKILEKLHCFCVLCYTKEAADELIRITMKLGSTV